MKKRMLMAGLAVALPLASVFGYQDVYAYYVWLGAEEVLNTEANAYVVPSAASVYSSPNETQGQTVEATFTAKPPVGYRMGEWLTNTTGRAVVRSNMGRTGIAASTYTWTYTQEGNADLGVRFDPIDYSLSYQGGGATGGSMSNETHSYTDQFSLAVCDYSWTGYTFAGWTNELDAAALYADGFSVTNGSSLCATNDRGTVVLYATWTANRYTLTLDPNGGALNGSTAPAEFQVTYGSSDNNFHKADERTGYTFGGWFTAADGGTMVYDKDGKAIQGSYWDASYDNNGVWHYADDLKVYAHWTTNKYTVTFNNHGATTAGTVSVGVTYDQAPSSINIPSWGGGYTFGGYFTEENGAGTQYWDSEGQFVQPVWNIAADTTLHAYRMSESYTLYYNANGGTGMIPDGKCEYGDSITLPDGTDFTRPGFVFSGWAMSADASSVRFAGGATVSVNELTSFVSSGSLTFYAVWSDLRRSLEFDVTGGLASEALSNRTIVVGSPFGPLPDAAWEGGQYEFLGWYTEVGPAGEKVTSESIVPAGSGSITLYAHWNVSGFFVAFDGNGETVGEMAEQPFDFDTPQALSTNTYAKAGYTFKGWATNEASAVAREVAFADGAIVSNLVRTANATATLFAVWGNNAYSTAFSGNGGTGVVAAVENCLYDEEWELPTNTFVREGFRFVGWGLDPTGTVAFADFETVSNLTAKADGRVWLYALWSDASVASDAPLSVATGCANLDLTDPTEAGLIPWTVLSNVVDQSGNEQVAKSALKPPALVSSRMQTELPEGTGVLTFWYRTAIDNSGLEDISRTEFIFIIEHDTTREIPLTVYGDTDWTKFSYTKTVTSACRVNWDYLRKEMYNEAGDPVGENDEVWVDGVTWTPDTVENQAVTFRLNDGTPAPDDIWTNITCLAGTAYGEIGPADPVRSRWEFLGWYRADGSEVISTDTVPGEDTTLYAHWLPLQAEEVAVPVLADVTYTGDLQTADVFASEQYTVVTNEGGTNAGVYSVVLALTDTDAYRWAGGDSNPTSLTFTITQAVNAWTAAPSLSGWTSGETPSEPDRGAAKFGDVDVSYRVPGESGTVADCPTAPGDYVAVFTVEGTENYSGLTNEVLFTIATPGEKPKSEVSLPVIADVTYTGNLQTADVPASEQYAVITNEGGTSAGVYSVVLALTDTDAYRWADGDSNPTSLTFTITQAANGWTAMPSMAGWRYGETPSEPNRGAAKFGDVDVSYRVSGESDTVADRPTAPGDYIAVFSVPETADWTGLEAEIPFEIKTMADVIIKAGNYFKKTLAELGYDVPTDGTPYSVVAKGLPSGLELKYNAAEKDKAGKVVTPAKTTWWIEGVPTSALDYATRPPYLVITVDGVAETVPLALEVEEQAVTVLADLKLGKSLNKQFYLPGVTNGWTVSGLPPGLEYTAKLLTTKTKSGKKTVVTTNALPYSVYGKTTEAGLFTITAKKKKESYYRTMKYQVLVRPKAVDATVFGDFLTNRTTMAYKSVAWNLKDDVAAVGGKVVKVTGLPKGLSFTATNTYYATKKKVKQAAQTITGAPTKVGTYVVTFTKNVTTGSGKNKKTVAKTAQMLWTVTENDAELSLEFNVKGGVIETGSVGLKYGSLLAFDATEAATVTASGLPSGITLMNLGGGKYAFTGFTVKKGTYLVTVKAKLNGKTVTQRVALKVDTLPAWATGAYNGVAERTGGLVAIDVTEEGAISGKIQELGTNWTFSADCYTGFDGKAYSVPVTAKYAYNVTKTVNGKKTTSVKYLKRKFSLGVARRRIEDDEPCQEEDEAARGVVTMTEKADGSTLEAWQNLWKSAYKKIGKKLFTTKSGTETLAYKNFTIKSTDEVGKAMGLTKAMKLTLKVTTTGVVTAKMTFDTGKTVKDAKTKEKVKVYYKPTCSTVVIPTSAPDAETFTGEAFLYFAPSPADNFGGFVGTMPF